jgi:hypothetical protein
MIGAAALGMTLMTGLSPAMAQGGNTPVEGIDIIIKEAGISPPIKPFSLNGGEIKTLNKLKGADRPAFVLKTVAKRIGAGDSFVQSGMKALGDIWCGPCKMADEIAVKFPDGKTTYLLEIKFKGGDIARPSKMIAPPPPKDGSPMLPKLPTK